MSAKKQGESSISSCFFVNLFCNYLLQEIKKTIGDDFVNTIKISYDQQSFHAKPSGDEIRWINNRIAGSAKELDRDGLQSVITRIGSEGCTFSPATFINGKRKIGRASCRERV